MATPEAGSLSDPQRPRHDPRAEARQEVVMPGDPEQLAQEIQEISPENRPADPKLGPKALRMGVVAIWLMTVIVAIALGYLWNPYAGIAAFVLGTLGILVNPVVGATEKRAEEREIIAAHHPMPDPPDTTVIRTTSRRNERRYERVE